ncbi:hypothetical protein SCLCIDRAFT_1218580 [Scleroderma citrinum Foug A]|uniref:Uncharacterized protein n=1 Tax=Scleroderma citrinum Foug A TaxID=1036808 RepID=A0A0C3DR27_9AGAM|nr:hypothetical protein SCLCIDRAFT_1218580 [Scleroderma citrinum Foug A]
MATLTGSHAYTCFMRIFNNIHTLSCAGIKSPHCDQELSVSNMERIPVPDSQLFIQISIFRSSELSVQSLDPKLLRGSPSPSACVQDFPDRVALVSDIYLCSKNYVAILPLGG